MYATDAKGPTMTQSLFEYNSERLILSPDAIEPPVSLDNVILNADARFALRSLPPQCADTIITSPPYYGQRDYGDPHQVGIESSINEYIEHIAGIFDDAYHVLHDRGTLWLNIGDKYIDGQLSGLPWRVVFSLKERGWLLRSDIIWHKPNAMPSSVRTRPTPDHEYLFLFVKTPNYYYDSDAIREPHVTFTDKSRMRGGRNHFGKRGGTPEQGKNNGDQNLHDSRWDQAFHKKGRNKRTVWEVPLSKYRDAHFAVFPERLIEPCVKAGAPVGGLVLDPFFGAGTSGLVALKHQRRFIGIEISRPYCEQAAKRLFPYLPHQTAAE